MSLTANAKGVEFALPESLLPRLMRELHWANDFTKSALIAYRQFIKLVLEYEDWGVKRFLPPPMVDIVWRQHLLHPIDYQQSCMEYCGHVVDYDPELDRSHKKERVKSTKIHLRMLFGNEMVWNDGEDLVGQKRGRPEPRNSDEYIYMASELLTGMMSGNPAKKKPKKQSSQAKRMPSQEKKRVTSLIENDPNSKTETEKAAALAHAIARGVTMRPSGKWQAQLYFAGMSRYVGVFDTREEACLAHEVFRKKLKSEKVTDDKEKIKKVIIAARQAAYDAVKDKQNGTLVHNPAPNKRGAGAAATTANNNKTDDKSKDGDDSSKPKAEQVSL